MPDIHLIPAEIMIAIRGLAALDGNSLTEQESLSRVSLAYKLGAAYQDAERETSHVSQLPDDPRTPVSLFSTAQLQEEPCTTCGADRGEACDEQAAGLAFGYVIPGKPRVHLARYMLWCWKITAARQEAWMRRDASGRRS